MRSRAKTFQAVPPAGVLSMTAQNRKYKHAIINPYHSLQSASPQHQETRISMLQGCQRSVPRARCSAPRGAERSSRAWRSVRSSLQRASSSPARSKRSTYLKRRNTEGGLTLRTRFFRAQEPVLRIAEQSFYRLFGLFLASEKIFGNLFIVLSGDCSAIRSEARQTVR